MVGWAIIAGLRLLGGLSLSNDAAAGVVCLTERAPTGPSLHATVVPAAMAAGALGSACLALLLSWAMPAAQLAASGWRVVLVLSLVAHSISCWLQCRVLQPPGSGLTAAELADQRNMHVCWVLR